MGPDTSWFVLKAKISVYVSSLKCWNNLFKYLDTNHIGNQETHGWGFLSCFGNAKVTVPERQDKGTNNKQTYWNKSRNDREDVKLVTPLHRLVHLALPLRNLCLLLNMSGWIIPSYELALVQHRRLWYSGKCAVTKEQQLLFKNDLESFVSHRSPHILLNKAML